MRHLITRTATGVVLAVLAFLAGMFIAPASASAYTHGIGGEACAKDQHGHYRLDNGVWYQCQLKGKIWRWIPTTSPAPSVTTTSPAGSHSATPTPTGSGTAGALAVTGPSVPLMAGAGGGLILLGVGGVLVARRRRQVEFTA